MVGVGRLAGPTRHRSDVTQASIAFDVLVAWAKPPSLTSSDEPLAPTLDLGREVLASASVDGATVELISTWSGEVGDINVAAQRQCWLRMEFPESSFNDLLDNWVRPLQDMLIVLLGRPVRLTKLALRPADATDSTSVRVVFGAIQAGPEVNLAPLSLISWGRETMFTREELPVTFADLIKGWFAARTDLSEAVTLLCSPFYAPFMYSEHPYAATFQSAESIARARYAGAEKAKDEHAARVQSIIEAARASGVKAEDVEWAERVLRSRNDKTLTNLIEELLADAGPLGEAILARDPNFASTAASARTRVSHPGGERGVTTVQRYWYGQVLLWVVRARLAIEVGIPAEDVFERIIKRGTFTQSVERLDKN